MPDTPQTELTEEQRISNTQKLRFMIVQQATIEVLQKHRDEILKLAEERIKELGLTEQPEVIK